MNYIFFNNDYSYNKGILVSGEKTFNGAKRSVESLSIAGRNGALTIDNGRYDNVTIEYPALVKNLDEIKEVYDWLYSTNGYAVLRDSYHPLEFRMARYVGGAEVDAWALNKSGEILLTFDAMPQRFLDSGEIVRDYTRGGTIVNPTLYDAKPLITAYVTGAGTLTIGEHTIGIKSGVTGGAITIDCEMQNCYNGLTNLNKYVTLSEEEFPVLKSGGSAVSFSGAISKVSIKPRWWCL